MLGGAQTRTAARQRWLRLSLIDQRLRNRTNCQIYLLQAGKTDSHGDEGIRVSVVYSLQFSLREVGIAVCSGSTFSGECRRFVG